MPIKKHFIVILIILILSLVWGCNSQRVLYVDNEYWFETNKQFIKEHIIASLRELHNCEGLHEHYCNNPMPKHNDIVITFIPIKNNARDKVVVNMHYSYLDAYYIEWLEARLDRLFYFPDNDTDNDNVFDFYVILTIN